MLSVKKFAEFCEVIHTYRAMHSIERIHLLTPLLSTNFLNDLAAQQPKGEIKVYSLAVSKTLEQYPCFISDMHSHNHTSDDDIDLTAKSSE